MLTILVAGLSLAWPIAAPRAEVVVGFANPLSGPYAQTGQSNLLGVMAAVERLNASGGLLGQPVRLVTADDRCGVDDAVAAATTLVDADAVMVVGHLCSHSSLMAAAVYDVAEVVMITPDSTHPQLTEEGRPNVFRVIGRDDDQAAAAAALIASRWPESRLAVLHDGTTYAEALATETRVALRLRDVDVVLLERYAPHQADYETLIEALREAGIDLLYIAGYGPDAGRIVRDARRAGLPLQVMGGDGREMEGFWAEAAGAAEAAIFTSPPAPIPVEGAPSDGGRSSEFTAGALRAYAAVEVWAEAVRRAGSLETKAVLRKLRLGHFDTTLGPLAFDAKGDLVGDAWAWRTWHDGQTILLE